MTAVTAGLRSDDRVAMDPLAAQFVRYRERGDVAALGAVFDSTASRLVSLAMQLCGSANDAEDLLQATFVVAIQKAGSFDAQQPLLPWLCGILAGEASNLRRSVGRRRSEPLPELAASDGGPLAASERNELIAVLRAHVERLPDEQRQVLLLQLQHGLQPAAIAEVLGVAPGTVRMRIHRGLATLRRLLPAGLASLLLAALPLRGLAAQTLGELAAVRRAVLSKAKTTVPVAIVGGGMLAMKKVVLAGVVIAFVLLGAVLVPAWWNARADAVARPSVQPAVADDAVAVREEDAAEVSSDDRRIVAASPEVVRTEAAFGTGSLRVRVVQRETRAPGGSTAIVLEACRGDLQRGRSALRAHSDDAGVAHFRGLPVGTYDVQANGGQVRRVQLAADAVTEIELAIAWRGFAVRGRVVHADGRAAPGASIVLGTMDGADVVAAADDAGAFALREVYPYDRIGARIDGHAPSLLQSLQPERTIELVLPGPSRAIEGVVVDAHGSAVVGAAIEVASTPPRQWLDPRGYQCEVAPVVRAHTDAAGHFAVAFGADECTVAASASGHAPAGTTVAAGSAAPRPLRIVLSDALLLAGRVVDRRGAAVADVDVQIGGLSGDRRRTDASGAFAFTSAPPGPHVVRIEGDAIEPWQGEHDCAQDRESWTIAVDRRPQYPLRFVDEAGAPLAGWLACVTTLSTRVQPTDADGRATLVVPVADRGQLRLHSPTGAASFVDWPLEALPGVEATVVVRGDELPTSHVTGRVLDANGQVIAAGRVELHAHRPGQHVRQATIEGGRFTTDPLLPGDYDLELHRDDLSNAVAGRVTVTAVRRGETRDLGDVRLWPLGQLAFRLVRTDGGQLLDPSVFVWNEHGDEMRAPSTDGTPMPWPIGRYRYRVMAEGALWVRGVCEVGTGSPTPVELALQPAVRRQLRFPVPTPAWGTPQRVHYTLRTPAGEVYDEDDFDPREELPMSFAPTVVPGTWRLELVTDAGLRFVGSFTVDDLQPRATATAIAVQPTR